MEIKKLVLDNYRNYNHLELTFNDSRNIIVGKNAQGKTNLLEAIYLCSFAKSFRTNNTCDLVKFGSDSAKIVAFTSCDMLENCLSISLHKSGKKNIQRDGKSISRTGELLNHIVSIVFSPDDLKIIKDSPDKRRAFINRELSQLKPAYFEQLKKYNNALKQKNALLKTSNINSYNENLLDVYDRQLSASAYEIIKYRKHFVEKLSVTAAEIMKAISKEKEALEVYYQTSCIYITDSNGIDLLYDQFRLNRKRDLLAGTSTTGPHRDDLAFFINGTDARKYGSQGQQRTIALSLKLAEIKIAKELLHDSPILLLDDVLSELDLERQQYLLSQIDGIQLFITSTEIPPELISTLNSGTIYNVDNGSVIVNPL